MTKELFLRWVKHFQQSVKCTLKEPVLLILDGHVSHSKNLEAIIFAKENGIIMLSLPPHTTHRLQPLDRTFYKPLMVYYNQACDMWIRTERRNVTVFQISRLFGNSYARAATMTTAQRLSMHGSLAMQPKRFRSE